MKNYTTTINAYKSIGEIQQILSKNRASKIVIDNDEEGNPIALTFSLNIKEKLFFYSLPCRVEGIQAVLSAQKIPNKFKTWEHALNVGWRILKDWIEAQISIIQAEMVDMEEVFLPYLILSEGQTLYDKFLDSSDKFLQISN